MVAPFLSGKRAKARKALIVSCLKPHVRLSKDVTPERIKSAGDPSVDTGRQVRRGVASTPFLVARCDFPEVLVYD